MSDQEIILPKCPNCEQEMPTVPIYMWTIPPFAVVSCYCPHCQIVLSTQVLPIGAVTGEPLKVVSPH